MKTATVFFFIGLAVFALADSSDSSDATDNAASTDNSDSGCWVRSYGRGVGTPISTCPDGLEQDAALCYPPCQSGYYGVGPVCWQSCPSGFTDSGVSCTKPASYGRGAGYALWDESECSDDNPQGCEQSGLLYYPICATNFHAVGCCVCSPDCPDDMTDASVCCTKNTYGRGAGTPLVCAAGLEEDAALCYNPCDSGYTGNGPVCWGSCPSQFEACGSALCLPAGTCSSKMLQLAEEGLKGLGEAALNFEDPVGAAAELVEAAADIGEDLIYPLCN